MPPYRLQALLDIRTRAEDEATQAYALALKALEVETRKRAAMEEALARRRAQRQALVQAFLAEVTARGGGIGGFQQMSRFEARLKDEEAQAALELERQAEVVAQAQQLVEQRRSELAQAAMERKAIEKHREAWQTQVRRERAQKEELSQEEIGNTLHLQRARSKA